MTTILLIWLIYSIGALTVSFYAYTNNDELTTRQLWHIMAVWPLVLVRHLIEIIRN